MPFLEVEVPSLSDLSNSVELLTDIDVLGVEDELVGGLKRTIFDCKSSTKLSAINRAFWAAGLMSYTGCDEGYIILKARAVRNHRLSSLSLDIDLHNEQSFIDLGRTVDAGFPADTCYQASLQRWDELDECYATNAWAKAIYDLARHVIPLTKKPEAAFRRVLAELRTAQGQFDPAKDKHLAIFLDLLASCFVLWARLSRDIRRFYEPTMNKQEFETILKFYLWGGKESYAIRQQMRASTGDKTSVDLPSWPKLIDLATIIIGAPQDVLACAYLCRELAMKFSCSAVPSLDMSLSAYVQKKTRLRSSPLH